MSRVINQAGLDLIRNAEGLRLKAYPDPGTGGAPWTIGYGHTGPEVKPGMVITTDQATSYLVADLARFEQNVTHLAPKCSDNQFAALVSFAFNCGTSNLKTSTLLRYHNAGNYAGAAGQFPLWCHAAGKTLPGLYTRRIAEAVLYMKGLNP